MKKIFTLLFAVIAGICTLFASDTSVDGIWYDFNNEDQTATVTFRGEYTDSYLMEYSGVIIIPESVIFEGKTYRVTKIRAHAFRSCTGLTAVTIPNSVKSIGQYAFYNCTGLTSVTIPESVENIHMGATFQRCTSLKEVHWNAINCEIDPFNEKGRLYPPFYDLSSITNFTFGDKVRKIPACLCYGLSGLTSIEIPNSVTAIGDYAFTACTGLNSIEIPNSVTSIGLGAFHGCSGLTAVTIPESVVSIQAGATFQYCTSLKEVHWNAIKCDIIPMDDKGHYYPPFGESNTITNFTLGDNVQTIPASLCGILGSLTTVTIPDGVTSIGKKAFQDCSSMASVTIPNSVTDIEFRAFYNCSGLTNLTIGNGIKTIGDSAFAYCDNFDAITCYAREVPTIQESTFAEIGNKKDIYLYVPEGSQRAYLNDQYWGEFNVQVKSPTGVQTVEDERGKENTATVQTNSRKLLRNDQIYILRDDKTYTVTGLEVK